MAALWVSMKVVKKGALKAENLVEKMDLWLVDKMDPTWGFEKVVSSACRSVERKVF